MHILYRLFGESNDLLYIGITNNIFSRIYTHSRDKDWFSDIRNINIEHFNNRKELKSAEILAIKNESPPYNKDHSNEFTSERSLRKLRTEAKRFIFKELINDYVSMTGKTWFQTAYELDICHTAISRWKCGRICPSVKTIKELEKWSDGYIKAEFFSSEKLDDLIIKINERGEINARY